MTQNAKKSAAKIFMASLIRNAATSELFDEFSAAFGEESAEFIIDYMRQQADGISPIQADNVEILAAHFVNLND